MAEWTVDAEALESVAQAMEQYGAGAGQIVDSVLQTQGAQLIKEQIAMLEECIMEMSEVVYE